MGLRLATVTQDGDGDGAGDTSLEVSACCVAAGCWALPRRDGGLGWMEGTQGHSKHSVGPGALPHSREGKNGETCEGQ